jgi:transcriptional regulator with XRE-family HTH domain
VSDTSDLQHRLGVRIRLRRAALGLTQCVLGSRVGVSRATIANVEAGRQNLTLRRLDRLARALETGLDELFRPEPDAR